MNSRLTAKRELEKRYLQLINQAHKVSDLLEIERELGTARSEIESLEGRIFNMDDKISYSTLRITFYELNGETYPYTRDLANAFQQGKNALL